MWRTAPPRDRLVSATQAVGLLCGMPTVLVRDGFRVRIYLPPREHAPPHVHVIRAGAEIVIALGSADSPPEVLEVHHMRTSDVVRAYRIVEAHQPMLLQSWSHYHG